MKEFTLTNKKQKELIKHFTNQGSVSKLANLWDISRTTLYKVIKQNDLNIEYMRANGTESLKQKLFIKLMNGIDLDTKDQIRLGMDYLTRFPNNIQDTVTPTDDEELVQQILKDIS